MKRIALGLGRCGILVAFGVLSGTAAASMLSARSLSAAPLEATWADPVEFATCRMGPEIVPMQPTQSAPGSRASMILIQPESPFEITVDAGGRHAFDVTIQVDRLRRRPNARYVVWAAKPELDEYVQLGVLEDDRLTGSVAWNQFMVFVSEEATEDVDRWQGPIVLRGLSPSGRLHTMAGHGPFEDVSCQQVY